MNSAEYSALCWLLQLKKNPPTMSIRGEMFHRMCFIIPDYYTTLQPAGEPDRNFLIKRRPTISQMYVFPLFFLSMKEWKGQTGFPVYEHQAMASCNEEATEFHILEFTEYFPFLLADFPPFS